MPDYATSQLALIDERVRAGLRLVTKMGTVSSRDPSGARAMVAMDGSSGTAQPVKCFENVVVADGDRVGLVKFEGDWIIVGNYTLRTLGTAHFMQEFAGGGATATSASYTDMPSSPACIIQKVRSTTQLRIRIALSMFSSATLSRFRIGANIASVENSIAYDQDVILWYLNTNTTHFANSGTITTAANLPAGSYTITARWLRATGSGAGTVNADDQISIEVEEVVN